MPAASWDNFIMTIDVGMLADAQLHAWLDLPASNEHHLLIISRAA